jgi:putative membrane protein
MKTQTTPNENFNSIVKACFFTTVFASLFFISCKQSDNTPDTKSTETDQTDSVDVAPGQRHDDNAFLADAAIVNMEEIELGKLAQSRSASRDVKDFGEMMVEGHTKSLNELKDLASKKGISLPQDISEKGKKIHDELTNAQAKDFDKMYIDEMVKGHKETISKFEDARNNASDTDVKSWAEKTLPGLKMHLDHAVMAQEKINK